LIAILKIDYTYAGWNNAINLLAEVHGHTPTSNTPGGTRSPIQVIRSAGYIALSVASVLFLFVNLALFVAVPKEQLRSSGTLAAAVFFEVVYGKHSVVASKVFPTLVALSCVGGTVSTVCTRTFCLNTLTHAPGS